MRKIIVLITILAFICPSLAFPVAQLAHVAHAAEDQFIVGQTVILSPDLVAPSVPANLTATAVSQTQIDLSWNASTDNSSVAGYQVFRDMQQIATSTLTTYSDSGLSPSTLYMYTVRAFDPSQNISAHSATATATTFDPVPVATTTPNTGSNGNSGGGRSGIELVYLSVSPDLQSALIRFGLNMSVHSEVYWGRTADYEMGGISSALYQKDHSVELNGLMPATTYFFKIDVLDGYGRHLIIENQSFTTLNLADTAAPANVSNFRATPSVKDILLTWNNPKADFDFVRIVKSEKFYPRDVNEGEVIYEGRAESFLDTEVRAEVDYYYTAFSRDFAGNYSSGAVTDAALLGPGEKAGLPKLFANVLQLPKEMIHALLKTFSVADIDFIQDGMKLPVVDGRVDIRGDRNLTISIDYEKMPEILKTIAVTMYDPADTSKTFSFLLRVNADKTAYQAHIGAFERPGTYQFALAILDYKNQGLASAAGVLIATVPNLVMSNGLNFEGFAFGMCDVFWAILVLLVLLALMFVSVRRKVRV